jgi:hypothetical protein|tara:strand:+ start:233 stop:535 length:303 start_codon:yes stop_codon:yes gene_type:complete
MARKVRINKAIYGKKIFDSRVELDYYKRYKLLNLNKELVMEVHEAVGKAEGYIPCDSVKEEIEAWQYLIDTGMAWKLQGWFGRQAHFLIEMNICKEKVVQ